MSGGSACADEQPRRLVGAVGLLGQRIAGGGVRAGAAAAADRAELARAAVAVGADGLIIEVHNDPDHALSDGAQSMFPAQFDRLMAELRIIAPAIGRSICLEPVARRGWAR